MADKMELLLEAERRGLLPPDKQAALAEARKRGLVSAPQSAAPQQEAPQPRSAVETYVTRPIGQAARYTMEGLGSTVGIFSDPIANAMGVMPARQLATTAADRIGLPGPEGAFEEVVAGASRAVAGAAPILRAGQVAAQAPGLTGRVGQTVADAPRLQAASAALGGASASTAEQMGAGPGGQAIAGLAGALAPAGAVATTRGLVRGGEQGRQGVIDSIEQFNRAGAGSPTVGQASGRSFYRGLEALLGRTPGGAGVITRAAERQQAGMGQRVDDLARSMSPGATAEKAGRGIERGVTGPGGFMSEFRKQANKLYGEVDSYIPPATPIPVGRTKATLDALASPTPGAEKTSQVLASGRIADIRNALDDDLQASLAAAGRGELPYEAVKSLRSRLGELIQDSTFATDVPTKQLKQVYGALSEDMMAAAKATGNPDAIRAVTRASNYYKNGLSRMEVLERVVERNGGGEKIYQAAIQGTRDGATTLRAVMQSLPRDAQKQLSAAFVRRMGKPLPGTQDSLEEGFSSERFLTAFKNMSPEAQTAMFGRFGPKYVKDIEAIAGAAASRRASDRVFTNPSKTTDGVIQAGTILGFFGSVFSGGMGTAALIGGGVAGANRAAAVMTSPVAVGWLAKQTNAPIAALPAQIAKLKAEAYAKGDEDAMALATALEEAAINDAGNNAPDQQQRR
jgi:hypothetical protein